MYIHRYKIDNVLEVYRRQLSRKAVKKPDNPDAGHRMPAESVVISAEGKRQSIINRVSDKIIRKIVDFNNFTPTGHDGETEGAS